MQHHQQHVLLCLITPDREQLRPQRQLAGQIEATAGSSTERVGKIAFIVGPRTQAAMQGGVLTITVTPKEGIAGRPSSRRIQKAVWGR